MNDCGRGRQSSSSSPASSPPSGIGRWQAGNFLGLLSSFLPSLSFLQLDGGIRIVFSPSLSPLTSPHSLGRQGSMTLPRHTQSHWEEHRHFSPFPLLSAQGHCHQIQSFSFFSSLSSLSLLSLSSGGLVTIWEQTFLFSSQALPFLLSSVGQAGQNFFLFSWLYTGSIIGIIIGRSRLLLFPLPSSSSSLIGHRGWQGSAFSLSSPSQNRRWNERSYCLSYLSEMVFHLFLFKCHYTGVEETEMSSRSPALPACLAMLPPPAAPPAATLPAQPHPAHQIREIGIADMMIMSCRFCFIFIVIFIDWMMMTLLS